MLCALASARRLWLATNATGFHPEEVVKILGPMPTDRELAHLRDAIAKEPRAEWERDLLSALDAKGEERAALVNEQLRELDWRLQRWAGVPAVCARISTACGLICGVIILSDALSEPTELATMLTTGVIGRALGVAITGIAGTTFSIAAHRQARTLARARLRTTDVLVEKLEAASAQKGVGSR